MLKALELVGFKSFADKSRIDFPTGITAIVGPNGSGKSNVVDAIKWVLGEQSVKSLRGKEMVDCIFNGSGTRAAQNSAEATLVLDNSRRLLPLDAPEVHITRRVYRSGEGEYLINRQPSRLRDIRELFAGTGVATEAYSVIEQGKVDVLLQASPKDRRAIFEEAAGISRFKAKKIESLRRLERVEQNLLRLSDIVEEVESRLRSIRAQASKARRYQELVDRLQQLRTLLGMSDWRRFSSRLDELDAEQRGAAERRDAHAAAAKRLEGDVEALDAQRSNIGRAIDERETQIARLRERIAAGESAVAHCHARHTDHDEEVGRLRRQLIALNVRAGDVRVQLVETAEHAAAAEEQHRAYALALAEVESQLAAVARDLDARHRASESDRQAHVAEGRALAAAGAELARFESQLSAAEQSQAECAARMTAIDAERRRVDEEQAMLAAEEAAIARAAAELSETLAQRRSRLAEMRAEQTRAADEIAQWRHRHTRASERAEVIEELERRFEGVDAGVRYVLEEARAGRPPWNQVLGLVADLVQAPVEIAALVDIALGEHAQHVVVRDLDGLALAAAERQADLASRVAFLSDVVERAAGQPDLSSHACVVGRCDLLVQAASECESLVRALLGRAWIVETLRDALRLAAGEARGCILVTRGGERVADGTVSVGPRHASAGLVSRRSELRSLRREIESAAQQIARRDESAEALQRAIDDESKRAEALASEHAARSSESLTCQAKRQAVAQRARQLDDDSRRVEAESASSALRVESAAERVKQLREQLAASEQQVAALEQRTALAAAEVARLDAQRREHELAVTAAKVALAKSEERLSNLLARRQQFERDQQERDRSIGECRDQLEALLARDRQTVIELLAVETELAELYLEKESASAALRSLALRLDEIERRRASLTAEAERARSAAHDCERHLHELELAAGEVKHERTALVTRLREDYAIELDRLSSASGAPVDEPPSRDETEREIAELRRKINHLGNVNLEALEELTSLEQRYASLKSQHDDLAKAKRTLERIVGKINADSRRLFAETLEAVRGHFQELFRKLFGGGQADVVLEEDVDILDSGIEIVARPPGKEPRNISLLSGGEKTLTCVALLLAVFQYRPSPFCVLDEVDAALDEANIERFVGVLQEFLAWTQFIVVTHSKKTMTCATTLHGVTMQESGVSKRVSVRFEDVRENGDFDVPHASGSLVAGGSPSAGQSSGDDTQAA